MVVLVCGAPMLVASSHAESPSLCRQGGVEWLVGGTRTARLSCEGLAPSTPKPPTQQVSAAQQLGRDQERLQILQQELSDELTALADAQRVLQSDLKGDPTLTRRLGNIAALRAEMARLPAPPVARARMN